MQKIEIIPISIKDANWFIDQYHRHSGPVVGALFALACACGPEIVGVATVGRPVARYMDNGWTAEVTRLCTNGTKNAASKLYGACWRAARSLGWRKLITYTLQTERGTSLNAAGWKCIAEVSKQSWHRKNRPRINAPTPQKRFRWEITI